MAVLYIYKTTPLNKRIASLWRSLHWNCAMIDSSIYIAIFEKNLYELGNFVSNLLVEVSTVIIGRPIYEMHFFNDFIIQHWIKAYYREDKSCDVAIIIPMLFGQYTSSYKGIGYCFTWIRWWITTLQKHGLYLFNTQSLLCNSSGQGQ